MTSDVDRAVKLFREFHDREPRDRELFTISQLAPVPCFLIGSLDGVIYRIDSSKEPLIHRFNKSHRPLLCSSFDGRQIYTLKGAYRFTRRGFVG